MTERVQHKYSVQVALCDIWSRTTNELVAKFTWLSGVENVARGDASDPSFNLSKMGARVGLDYSPRLDRLYGPEYGGLGAKPTDLVSSKCGAGWRTPKCRFADGLSLRDCEDMC